jgi:hypothetical protein
MATVTCWSEYHNVAPLSPGSAIWFTWGPSDLFNGAAVTITPRATTSIPGGGTAANVMGAGPVFTTAVPGSPGSPAGSADSYIGANMSNAGPAPIVGFTMTVSVTQP